MPPATAHKFGRTDLEIDVNDKSPATASHSSPRSIAENVDRQDFDVIEEAAV
jgi:ParB family chromosome partitioning protein